MSDELKPCPWCGGKASIVVVRPENYGYWAETKGAVCQTCGAHAPSPYSFETSVYDWEKRKHVNTKVEAIEKAFHAWNKRAPREKADEAE